MNNINLSELAQKKSSLKPAVVKETTMLDVLGKMGVAAGFSEKEDSTEYYDTPEEFRAKAIEVAKMIKIASHVVVYTGAGISTGAGANLPDYRGKEGTWTLLNKGEATSKSLDLDKVLPTYSHMAISAMMKEGFIHHVVSTNVDGLHLHSGIPSNKLSELHGDAYIEACGQCKEVYLRDFDVTRNRVESVLSHITIRKCEKCGGNLLDNIVNFGEELPPKEFDSAMENSKKSTLALVLGTSLRVAPANEFPSNVFRNKGTLIICNLQTTPFDEQSFVVHGCVDDLMHIVVGFLGVEVPTTTPSGVLIVPYVDSIDTKYPEKREIMQQSIEEYHQRIAKIEKREKENSGQ